MQGNDASIEHSFRPTFYIAIPHMLVVDILKNSKGNLAPASIYLTHYR